MANESKPTRREILQGSVAASAALLADKGAFDMANTIQPNPKSSITDVAGIKVGHFTDTRRPTGCTVILCEDGATGGVERHKFV